MPEPQPQTQHLNLIPIKVQSDTVDKAGKLDFATMQNGGYLEQLNTAIAEIFDNLKDPNYPERGKREVHLKFIVTPGASGNDAEITLEVIPKVPKRDIPVTSVRIQSFPGKGVKVSENKGYPDGQLSFTES